MLYARPHDPPAFPAQPAALPWQWLAQRFAADAHPCILTWMPWACQLHTREKGNAQTTGARVQRNWQRDAHLNAWPCFAEPPKNMIRRRASNCLIQGRSEKQKLSRLLSFFSKTHNCKIFVDCLPYFKGAPFFQNFGRNLLLEFEDSGGS
jgi:hypothetical protein